MTIPVADANFLTGAVLSWAIPISVVLVVLGWWAGVLTIRAFRTRRQGG
jgi:uncharacterized membrane protein